MLFWKCELSDEAVGVISEEKEAMTGYD